MFVFEHYFCENELLRIDCIDGFTMKFDMKLKNTEKAMTSYFRFNQNDEYSVVFFHQFYFSTK